MESTKTPIRFWTCFRYLIDLLGAANSSTNSSLPEAGFPPLWEGLKPIPHKETSLDINPMLFTRSSPQLKGVQGYPTVEQFFRNLNFGEAAQKLAIDFSPGFASEYKRSSNSSSNNHTQNNHDNIMVIILVVIIIVMEIE